MTNLMNNVVLINLPYWYYHSYSISITSQSACREVAAICHHRICLWFF